MSGGGGESQAIYSGVNSALGAVGMAGNQGDTRPSAYLNYIMFDKDYKFLDMGWTVVPTSANMAQQNISIPTVNIKEQGYIFVYLSYEAESNNWVYFDDFKVNHTKTNVIQYNEYYPFGLQASTSWTRETNKNDFLYNAGSELNQTSGWYDLPFRNYDAALGRFMQVDPMAASEMATYQYAGNNPVYFNDPMGASMNPSDIDRWALAKAAAQQAGQYSQMYNEWNDTSFMPGSGGHWSDQYRSVQGNLMFMSTDDFRSFYNIDQMSDREIADFVTQNGLGTRYELRGVTVFDAENYQYNTQTLTPSNNPWKTVYKWVEVAQKVGSGKNGGPDIGDYVDPLSINLHWDVGRYATYVTYHEKFWTFMDLEDLQVYDEVNLSLDKIALSIRVKEHQRVDPAMRFIVARAFDRARLATYDAFKRRTIFNPMTDFEAEEIFMQNLNMLLQVAFPSPSTFFRGNSVLYGDVPDSKITFYRVTLSPN